MENIKIVKKIPKNVRLIGISGFAHSGKDTLTNFFIEERNDIIAYSFANPIKEILINYFGLSREQVYDQKLKEIIDDFWGITPRKLMQLIGTDMFRNLFRQDVWVKIFERNFLNNKNDIFIISDVRFNNEAKMISDNNGIIIKINRNNEKIINKNHESENGINNKFVNIIVDNNGDLNNLKNTSLYILNLINKGDIV